MTGPELLSLVPLLLASLVPACLVVAAFLVSRERARFLTVPTFVTTLTAGLAYLAVILRPLLSWAGYDARTTRPGSVMHDVVQLDVVSSAMFVLVSHARPRRRPLFADVPRRTARSRSLRALPPA